MVAECVAVLPPSTLSADFVFRWAITDAYQVQITRSMAQADVIPTCQRECSRPNEICRLPLTMQVVSLAQILGVFCPSHTQRQ